MKNKLQELTKKLYDEGLEKGRAEADDIFSLVTGLLDDLLGLGAGFGDDLRRLVLSLPDQTVGFGTAFLQPLVVELFGQLLKFVFHALAGKQAAAKIKSEIASMIVAKATAAGVKEAALDPAFIKEMLLAVARNWNGADAGTRVRSRSSCSSRHLQPCHGPS